MPKTGNISDEELLLMYAELSMRHGEATEAGNYKAANKAHDELLKVYDRIRNRGEACLYRLIPLLQSSHPGTRLWASSHCLSLVGKEAEVVLEELAKIPRSFLAFSAKKTLEEWRSGNLHL